MNIKDQSGGSPIFSGLRHDLMLRPKEGLVAILLTQRLMRSADDTRIGDNFLTLAYQAIDD